ncbi:MAG: diguanylate cyclase [Motiliproteus sp.]
MKLKTKITALTLVFVVAILVLLALVSSFAFRQFALFTAKEHARTTAEVVRVSMTESMINGSIKQRASFLRRLDDVDGLKEARVLRGPDVVKQFGAGLAAEQNPDAIEAEVMRTKKPYFRLVQDDVVFRATIPYIASDKGQPNCLQCHQVENGTVLGAVTITISIEELRHQSLEVLGIMLATLTGVAALFLLLFRRQLNPVIHTAQGVQEVVSQARLGEFSGRIDYKGDDEVAQIAKDLNRLMAYLEDRLGETCEDVAKLMQYELPKRIDLLQATTEMVAGLVDVSQFKQKIEDDQTQYEVYNRIALVIQNQFKIGHYSLYETNPARDRMIPLVVDGQQNAPCRWCDKAILTEAGTCRAFRTGRIIDSVSEPGICTRFEPGDTEYQHICIPILHSGSVGSVMQLVFNANFSEEIYQQLPLILVYLRESSSVVEAKRLMNVLRETTLKDAMTGLRNRRFLEEYQSTLIASTDRAKQKLSILMMDLDKFKSVNDTYGHEAGDTVLKALAKTLEQQVRESDLVIRYGGEEFMAILQETGEDYNGEILAEKIRASIEDLSIPIPNHVLKKTISIGLASFPQDSKDFWQAVKYADTALFAAKESGRNKVVRWELKMEQPEETNS